MRSFRLGSVFGIPIDLDLTFLIVLPVFAWIIGSRIARRVALLNRLFGGTIAAQPLSSGLTPWVLGSVAAVALFVGVVLHELGHSLTATHYGFEIDSITLWIFGGISQFSEIPDDWRQELAIAVAGPVVSVLLGALSYLAFRGIPAGANAAAFLFGYLALINVALALFNMLPGFPLDGGRVVRALLARSRPYATATRIAANVGKGVAVLLGLAGLATFDIVLMGVALFVYVGAASEAKQTVMEAALQGVTVGDVMTPAENVDAVGPDASIATLGDRMFREAHTGYPVLDGGDVVGFVTLDHVDQVETSERSETDVGDVMDVDVPTVATGESVMDVFREMQDADDGLHVVLEDGEFAGVVSRTDVMRAFRVAQSGGPVESPDAESTRDRPWLGASTDTAE